MKKLQYIVIGAVAITLTGCIGQAVPRLSLRVNPVTHEVVLSNPKDTTISDFDASVETNGVSHVKFKKLTTVMNPDVITTTGDAQAKLVEAGGKAAANAIAALPK